MKPIKKVILKDKRYEDGYSEVHEIKKWLDQLGIPSEFSSY